MGTTVQKTQAGDVVINSTVAGEVLPVLSLNNSEARRLAAQLLDETRTDVDALRARARRGKVRVNLNEREAWELVDQLLDEIEALRAKVRGEVAW